MDPFHSRSQPTTPQHGYRKASAPDISFSPHVKSTPTSPKLPLSAAPNHSPLLVEEWDSDIDQQRMQGHLEFGVHSPHVLTRGSLPQDSSQRLRSGSLSMVQRYWLVVCSHVILIACLAACVDALLSGHAGSRRGLSHRAGITVQRLTGLHVPFSAALFPSAAVSQASAIHARQSSDSYLNISHASCIGSVGHCGHATGPQSRTAPEGVHLGSAPDACQQCRHRRCRQWRGSSGGDRSRRTGTGSSTLALRRRSSLPRIPGVFPLRARQKSQSIHHSKHSMGSVAPIAFHHSYKQWDVASA